MHPARLGKVIPKTQTLERKYLHGGGVAAVHKALELEHGGGGAAATAVGSTAVPSAQPPPASRPPSLAFLAPSTFGSGALAGSEREPQKHPSIASGLARGWCRLQLC